MVYKFQISNLLSKENVNGKKENMCNHVWNTEIKTSYYDKNQKCRVEKLIHACIFCGKTRKETVLVKDPPKRKLPKFIKDDLSSV